MHPNFWSRKDMWPHANQFRLGGVRLYSWFTYRSPWKPKRGNTKKGKVKEKKKNENELKQKRAQSWEKEIYPLSCALKRNFPPNKCPCLVENIWVLPKAMDFNEVKFSKWLLGSYKGTWGGLLSENEKCDWLPLHLQGWLFMLSLGERENINFPPYIYVKLHQIWPTPREINRVYTCVFSNDEVSFIGVWPKWLWYLGDLVIFALIKSNPENFILLPLWTFRECTTLYEWTTKYFRECTLSCMRTSKV